MILCRFDLNYFNPKMHISILQTVNFSLVSFFPFDATRSNLLIVFVLPIGNALLIALFILEVPICSYSLTLIYDLT